MTTDEFQIHVVETLARLDTHMESLVGNGQPGRVTKLETAVDSLRKWRWTISGAVLGAAGLISAAIHFIFKY